TIVPSISSRGLCFCLRFVLCLYFFFFFFSSRRRHTRCYRDWSSDVCSSDLVLGAVGDLHEPTRVDRAHIAGPEPAVVELLGGVRSEERRVGKECRSRWSQEN